MRTAGSFLAILGGGVLIVMIYLWSGESPVVLVMSILTLFAAVVLYEWRPWAPDDSSPLFAKAGGAGGRSWSGAEENPPQGEPTGQHPSLDESQPTGDAQATKRPLDEDPTETIWRSRYDIIWDEDDLAGLALGDREPASWPWSTIEDLGLGVCQAIAQGDEIEQRLCLVLTIADKTEPAGRVPEGRIEAQLMFGAAQDPELVAQQATSAFRASWVTHSPLHALTAAERTRKLVDALSPTPISLSRETRSPELLYQELRRVLLTNRALRRLSVHSEPPDLIAAVEALLGTHQLARLSQAETSDLANAAEPASESALERALDRLVEKRERRLASIGAAESDDYLLGLIPAATARHWHGQPVGSGLLVVRVLSLG